ncbi:Tripeptidyl aminopeptidase [Paramyrothecium foliicola]|nr:Tripeptidyl aminopeptidase [Paramyrothecium foliicola]
MVFFRAVVFFSCLGAARAAIAWGTCNDLPSNGPLPVQCANLQVPLDYANAASNQTLTLNLARIRAINQPSKGTIQLNFGGPGGAARGDLQTLAVNLMGISGGHYDLVAFDPRGTGNTLRFACYKGGMGVLETFARTAFTNHSDVAPGATWAWGTLDARVCHGAESDIGSLIDTAYVARDLISFSYGTTLGATVAAMFPERIDKLILDGVQNPHEYYHATAYVVSTSHDFEEWTDSDKVFHGIFKTCLERPENCALSAEGSTAEEIENKVWDLLDRVKFHPIVSGTHLIDYTVLKAMFAFNLYTTALWPLFAAALQGLLHDETNVALEILLSIFTPTDLQMAEKQIQVSMALMGIHCSDRTARVASFEEYLPTLNRLYKSSRVMGDTSATLNMGCAQWLFDARERYEGDFHVRTANPILVIGNHFDGHTPLVSAYNVSSGFERSRVLEVAGYGHSAINVPSKCTVEKVSAYFNHGTLPPHGFVCNSSAPPYSGLGWPDVFADLAGNNSFARRFQRRDMELAYGFIPSGRRLI